jgi:hypothetical protein
MVVTEQKWLSYPKPILFVVRLVTVTRTQLGVRNKWLDF